MTQKERISDFVKSLLQQNEDKSCAIICGETDPSLPSANDRNCSNVLARDCGYNVLSCTNMSAEACHGALNTGVCNYLDKLDPTNIIAEYCMRG